MSCELMIKNLKYNNILKDINLTIKDGTIYALMGNNGCGKTLLLKSIFKLIETVGIISYDGIIITNNNIPEIRKKFGLYLNLNNLENKNVFLNLIEPLNNLNYEINKSQKKVYEISKKLGIENLLYKNVNTLSNSQKKIVSFAQSIIHDPKIIMIDGLFDSLDIYYKNKIVAFLKQLKKSKKCVIIFTTNNTEDLFFADNLIIIKNGKILINDSIGKIIETEDLFLKNDIKMPFIIDLSYKLKAYGLIDKLIYSSLEMVDEIWQ